MTAYVAMVRGVMPVGSGKLPAARLKAIGEECGFEQVRTFIATGNLLFASDKAESAVRDLIKARVDDHFGRPTPVFVRSGREMVAAVECNPFADRNGSRVLAHFIDEEPTQAMIDEARDVDDEELALGPRLIYVSYGDGMVKSKLKLPAVKHGTFRNMNSVTKMAALLAEMA